MSDWYTACAAGELEAEKPKGVRIEGVPLVLVRKPDGVFAMFGICSHAHAFMMKGYLEDYTLECPLHEGVFDIRSGKCLAPPPRRDLDVYEVKEEDGKIWVRLNSEQIARGVDHARIDRTLTNRPAP